MRIPAVLFSFLLFSSVVFTQVPEPTATPGGEAQAAAETVEDPAAVFAAASQIKEPAARQSALLTFLEEYPESEPAARARELLTATRSELAASALKAGDRDGGLKLFRLAISETASPVSDMLFTGVLLQIPNNLFFGGLREPAYELAGLIENKISADPRQLLGLATFYLAVEDAQAARRLAERAISLAPELPSAYQTLGLASRLGFDLTGAEEAYSRALELDPESLVSKRSLAELKRAVGKPEESIKLYDEIIAADPADANAGTGRTLALYDAGRLTEAESAKDTLLAVNSKNLVLLVGAAYWYAAHGEPEKAILHANGALAAEPRYAWAHIALARGLMASGRPLDAERVLLSGRQFGNFPTLEYELAAARLKAGFFRDASDVLLKNFSISDGEVKTLLGGRVEKRADNFIDLLDLERQASIFEPRSADDPADADRLKRLLKFTTVLEAGNAPEAVAAAADEFIEGTDAMRTHRQLYAAGRLLEKKVALEEVEKIAGEAGSGVEASLNVTDPAAAVLADQLYDSRKIAIARGSLVVVPDVPRQTLSRVIRGRIEELTGWAKFLKGDKAEAEVHLKRALSILPRESVWSRTAHWRMGTVLETAGRSAEALDNYIAGYKGGGEDPVKKIVVEGLYKRLNGSLDGLEEKLKAADTEPSNVSRFLKDPEKTVVVGTPQNAEPEPGAEGVKTDDAAGQESKAGTDIPAADNVSSDAGAAENNIATADETPEDVPADPDPLPKGDEGTRGDVPAPPAALPEEIERANREAMERLELDKPLVENPAAGVPAAESSAVDNAVEPAKSDPETDRAAEGSAEPVAAKPVDAGTEQQKAEGKDQGEPISAGTADRTAEEKPEDAADSGAQKGSEIRPRVVQDERSRLAGDGEEPAPCSIVLSQESLVITSSGGNAGVLAGIEGRTGVFSLKAISSSPQNVTVNVDSAAAEIAGRAVFVIRSVSAAKGIFTVTFQSSCGSKDVRVTVR